MTKIIAFEGIDGTGKSVQMNGLHDRLTAAGLQVATISFPVYSSFFGSEVGKLLTGKDGIRADAVDGKSMALWFALDRFEAFKSFSYADADILLINRYVLSNAVYQSIRDCDLGRADLLDFVLALEHEHLGIPRADIHIVLDMSIDDAADNIDKKGYRDYVGSARDVYESVPSLQQRAREKYRQYAQRFDNVFIIPCMEQNQLKSIEAIGSMVDEVLKDIL
ncbi:MAG: hypothetical protein RRZ24_02440 [Clostridia bacterium]